MKKTIQVRRGTEAQLAAYALQEGEPGFTKDTFRLYIGDGTTNHLVGDSEWPSDWDIDGGTW